jgi:hypothetical protein
MPRTEIDRSTDFLTTDQIVAGYSVVERSTHTMTKTGQRVEISALIVCHESKVIGAPFLMPETAIQNLVMRHQVTQS